MNRTCSRIAIYDMDKTITRRPTYALFLLHAARTRRGARLILAPFALVTIFLYMLRLVGRARLKEINHRLLIGARLPAEEARSLARDFARQTLATNIVDGARDRIAADRAGGCRLVLATASYGFYARAIGDALGFDDVVATEVATADNGDLLPRIAGENCYGPAKQQMVEAWLHQARLRRTDCHIRFYSDHVSDRPMFEFADEPIAVSAHAPLRTLARERGWESMSWI